jgi:hypothetical protein
VKYDDVEKLYDKLGTIEDDLMKDRITSFHFARKRYRSGELDVIGGLQYLDELCDMVANRINELRLGASK